MNWITIVFVLFVVPIPSLILMWWMLKRFSSTDHRIELHSKRIDLGASEMTEVFTSFGQFKKTILEALEEVNKKIETKAGAVEVEKYIVELQRESRRLEFIIDKASKTADHAMARSTEVMRRTGVKSRA